MNFFSLPRRLWWSHHFAFLLHDHLLELLSRGEADDLFYVGFPLNSGESDEINELEEGALLDWLRHTGRHDIADSVTERMLLRSILSDMCQFLFEAIECAAKGKISVAFALLRKPCRDHLFFLEWILADRDAFLAEFRKGPKAIDICTLLNTDVMKHIVEDSVQKSEYAKFVDADVIWDLRFDKSADWGYERLWNQAIHLVTTNKHYATDKENLNFIFIDDDQRGDLVESFYRAVPMVLIHACGVVRAIIGRINPDFALSDIFSFRLVANAELWLRETNNEPVEAFAAESINDLLAQLEACCSACNNQLVLSADSGLEEFARDTVIRCVACGHRDEQLIFSEEGGLAPDDQDTG